MAIKTSEKKKRKIFPVVSLGAEYLVMGHLMRRNIMVYKAPPRNEGYDLICLHPEPKKVGRQVRIQIKSHYQTDAIYSVGIKRQTLGAFDFLIVVNLNITYSKRASRSKQQVIPMEFYTVPAALVRKVHKEVKSTYDYFSTKHFRDNPAFRDEAGFELIAEALKIPYPGRRPKP